MKEITVEEFLAFYSPEVRLLALKTRDLVLETIPNTIEIVDPPSKIIAYGFNRKYSGLVCAIAPYKSYVNLIFSRGTELPDLEGLLTGTGKRARHVRIDRIEDISRKAVRDLLDAAAGMIYKKE